MPVVRSPRTTAVDPVVTFPSRVFMRMRPRPPPPPPPLPLLAFESPPTSPAPVVAPAPVVPEARVAVPEPAVEVEPVEAAPQVAEAQDEIEPEAGQVASTPPAWLDNGRPAWAQQPFECLLFSVGGLFSITEGWHKLHSPEPIKQAWVALLVLGVSIGLETFSTLGCLREINKLRRGRTLRQWVETTRNAELVVVLGEDLAALVGLVLAFVFVSMAAYTGNPIYDAFGSIVIGVVLIIVSLFIAVRIKGLIVGKSAEEDVQKAIHEHIEATEGIEDLLNAITMQLGPQVMLAVKVRMKPGISIEQAVEKLNALERSIKARFPEVAWCFVEPDTTD